MSTLKSKGCLFLASSLCDGLEDNNIKQVTTLLLNKEANPNTLIPMYGVTPFHLVIGNDSEAFAEEVTKLFLRHGGNPNVRSADGLTPVHVAAAWGRVTVLELLLANGGDPLCLDEEGRSPFHYAFDGKYYKAIVILGKYCENTIKEEKSTKYKITFDKLLINNGNVIAEYAALQNSNIVTESPLKEDVFQKYDKQKFTNIQVKYSFDSDGDGSLNNDDQFGENAAEFRIYEETNKEKVLVDEIINQLSNSLKSNFKQQEVNNEYELISEKNEYDTSPSSTISTDNSMMCNMREKLLLKNKTRRRSITPKHRHKIFKQNNNVKISLIPVYNPRDSIISKSPNFLIGEPVGKQGEYLSPKISSQKEMRFKAFTPCMTRNQSFQSEFNIEKEVARSTPRRRKQFYRQYSSLRKLKRNDGLTSSDNTSPDTTNSLSPDHNCIKRLNYKLSKNLAIKLDENKYDDDVLVNFNFDENKKNNEKYENAKDLIDGLNNNFRDLEIEKTNVVEKNEENLKERITSSENFLTAEERSKINSISNSFKENSNTFFSSFKSQSYISVQEEYKHEDEGMAFLERRFYTIPPCKSAENTSIDKFRPHLLNLSMEIPLTDQTIRRMLIALGDNPGPITNTTRRIYLKRLTKLEKRANNSSFVQLKSNHFRDFPKTNENFKFHMPPFLRYGDWVNNLKKYKTIEKNIFQEFSTVSPSRKWREGTNKTCFNYLLLDPRKTKEFSSEENIENSEMWSRFLSAIFYIGKGTHNRPLAHLKDAFDTWVSHNSSDNEKIQHILSIWNDGCGVICLRVFQNIIPVDAYTREAAMIDALGMQQLKNCKSGDYYGKVATWSTEEKRKFGRYLLYQAMNILIHDGERQIFPADF